MTAGPEAPFDVVVVGGGGCGLTAAVAAAQQGARVRLLEKEAALGGNTARSVGSVPGAGTRFQQAARVTDTPQLFLDDLTRLTGAATPDPRAEQMCRLSAELVHWLVDEVGVELLLTEDYKHVGHSVNRLHNPRSREGVELVNALERTARELGVVVDTSSPVSGIRLVEDGAEVLVDGDVVRARSVVLGTDGFGGSVEMKHRYCPRVADLPYFGAPGNTGDGIRWGAQLGARLDNMESFLGYAVMGVPRTGEPTWETMFSWTVLEIGGFAVDAHGRRFHNEDVGYSAFADAVVSSAGGLSVVVFDERRLEYVSGYEQRFRLLAERPDTPMVSGSDVETLAAAVGLPPEELRRTLESYNTAAAGRAADVFGRQEFGLGPLVPPLYACRTQAGLLTTQGGLLVNENAQVVLEDGDVLPQVYAGGSTAAGISGADGGRGYASGNGLLTALGYGLLAGRHAGAAHASERRVP